MCCNVISIIDEKYKNETTNGASQVHPRASQQHSPYTPRARSTPNLSLKMDLQ